MFTVTAHNYFRTIEFEQNYLDFDLALLAFNTATKCEDCAGTMLLDALTGEIVMAWNYVDGLTT